MPPPQLGHIHTYSSVHVSVQAGRDGRSSAEAEPALTSVPVREQLELYSAEESVTHTTEGMSHELRMLIINQ